MGPKKWGRRVVRGIVFGPKAKVTDTMTPRQGKTSILLKKGHCFGEKCSFIPKNRLFGHFHQKNSLLAILDRFLVLTPKQLHCHLSGHTQMPVRPSISNVEVGGHLNSESNLY